MTKWEYKVSIGKFTTQAETEAFFKEMGDEGWELCGFVNAIYIFKRPIQ